MRGDTHPRPTRITRLLARTRAVHNAPRRSGNRQRNYSDPSDPQTYVWPTPYLNVSSVLKALVDSLLLRARINTDLYIRPTGDAAPEATDEPELELEPEPEPTLELEKEQEQEQEGEGRKREEEKGGQSARLAVELAAFQKLQAEGKENYIEDKLAVDGLKREYMQSAEEQIKYKRTIAYQQVTVRDAEYQARFVKGKAHERKHCRRFMMLIDKKTIILGLEDVLVTLSLAPIDNFDKELPIIQGLNILATVGRRVILS
jgi:hypothetical protein